jgi:UDP-2-acetamido-3-amino-2,3-dideoxy-glucuronate N-acetyltransferase
VAKPPQVHPTAVIDAGAELGEGTRVWHFCHVMAGASIGAECSLGQNVFVAGDVRVGNRVKIQNNVSLYAGTVLEDNVFLGPSCVLTNVTNPRSEVIRKSMYERTLVRRGATIGANATVVCGITVGRYAFVGAGAVVTKDVPDYALVVGSPARPIGWMSRHGHRLGADGAPPPWTCPESGWKYGLADDRVECVDHPEDQPIPPDHREGKLPYRS